MPKLYSLIEKLHSQIIFGIVATLMVHPIIMKIHKNIPGDIPNIFPCQNCILIEKLHSQIIFCMVATLVVHPRVMKIHKNLPGDTPNDFPKLRGDWKYGF